MTNELFVVLSFGKNFCQYKDKNIVIYGKGPQTKLILDVYPDYNIIGIMDGTLKEGSIYNKPVLNIDSLSVLRVDVIIVVAQISTTALIFNRIKEYCYYRHIELYSISGKNIFEYFGIGKIAGALRYQYCVDEVDFEKAISAHDYIIADIMDVILMRKVIFEKDRFLIIEEKARQEGIDLEGFARVRSELERRKPSLDIDSIYSEIQKELEIGEAIKTTLLQIELKLEKSWIVPREMMVALMKTALSSGKKLYLINNTRIPQEVLKQILCQYGIAGYKAIITQNDWWSRLEVEKQQKFKKGIYIGAEKPDWAEEIKAFPVFSALELYRQSSYAYIEKYLSNVNERSLMSLCIAKVFNNPFVLQSDGRPYITEAEDIGYAFLGAILSNFVIWLGEKYTGKNYDGILFAARDGFLLQKMYNFFADYREAGVPEDIYFYASRRLCASAAMETEADIKWLAGINYKYTPEQMLRDKFGLMDKDIIPYDSEKFGNIITYSLLHKEKIYKRSREIRANYFKYMENSGIKNNGRYLFVDFLSVGTCQYFLERIIPFEMNSVYLCRHYNERNMVSTVTSESLLENQAPYAAESYFYGHIFFPETILTSPEPSVAGIDEKGHPVFAQEERDEFQMGYVELMQRSLMNFFEDYIENFYITGQPINPDVSDRIYNLMAEGYTEINCDILKKLYLVDGMGLTKVSPSY